MSTKTTSLINSVATVWLDGIRPQAWMAVTAQLNKLVATSGMYLDDHVGIATVKQQKVYVIYVNPTNVAFLCPAGYRTAFCLNPMKLDEAGVVHLSRWSVGGVVDAGRTLKERCVNYNATMCYGEIVAIVTIE